MGRLCIQSRKSTIMLLICLSALMISRLAICCTQLLHPLLILHDLSSTLTFLTLNHKYLIYMHHLVFEINCLFFRHLVLVLIILFHSRLIRPIFLFIHLISSSLINITPSITSSLFHSRVKTHLLYKSFRP